jgi:hypothetical protein
MMGEQEAPRSGLEYLVSWKELPLDQASWEAEEVKALRVVAGMGLAYGLWVKRHFAERCGLRVPCLLCVIHCFRSLSW